jgi:hypothetical protein
MGLDKISARVDIHWGVQGNGGNTVPLNPSGCIFKTNKKIYKKLTPQKSGGKGKRPRFKCLLVTRKNEAQIKIGRESNSPPRKHRKRANITSLFLSQDGEEIKISLKLICVISNRRRKLETANACAPPAGNYVFMFVELINCSLFSNDHFMHDL